MANLIPIIANELDLEISEVFMIEGYVGNYRFTHTDLQINDTVTLLDSAWDSAPSAVLIDLIYNSDLVIHLPFNPQKGEIYYTYTDCWIVTKEKWDGCAWDLMFQKAGCCFGSVKEAEKARPKIYRELTGKEWKDV